jgi:AcrR family transcriptional regulator
VDGAPARRYDLDSLLRVAVELFTERGYDGTSMELLSKRLGITKSAIYHHVSGKDELLHLAVDRALDALMAVARQAQALDRSAVDRLEYVLRSSVGVLIAERPFVTLLLRVRGNTEVERSALERRRELDHMLTDLVKQAVAEGDVRPDVDPAVTSRLLFGMVNSIIEWYRPRPEENTGDLATAVTTIAFDGLRTGNV